MSIIPTLVNNANIDTIIYTNNLIASYNNDIPVTDDDSVWAHFDAIKDNSIKSLELIIAIYKYAVRNNKIKVLERVFPQMVLIIDNISDIAIVERYLNLGISLGMYASLYPFISGNSLLYIKENLKMIGLRFLDRKALLIPIDDSLVLSDTDLRLSAMLDTLTGIINECYSEYTMTEASVKDMARKASNAIGKKIMSFTLADKQMSERINEKFNKVLREYQNNRKNASYESIVKQSLDLSRMIKQIISSSIVALLIPGGVPLKLIGGALTLLIQFSRNKKTDAKYKGVVINDLKFELKIVQEKIKDAEAKGDTKAKYKLMRIENQIGRAIDRITYGLSTQQM